MVALAMAMRRSSSMGPSVNPFWSQRTQEQIAVQQARPVDLPVPSGDEEDLDGSTAERPLPVEGLRATLQGSLEKEEESGSALQQAGEMKEHEVKVIVLEQEGQKTEGEMPMEEPPSIMEDGLQRALEREVVDQLHRENLQLKLEVEKLKEVREQTMSSAAQSSWSEVSQGEGGVPPPPPPLPRSRSPTRRVLQSRDQRFTPQGTKVPDTSPPRDEEVDYKVPQRPFEAGNYERVEEWMPCGRTWGPSLRGRIRDEDHGRLRAQGERRGTGFPKREEGHGDPLRHHGQEVQQMDDEDDQFLSFVSDDVMTASSAKKAWLQRELEALQSRMEREAIQSGGRLCSDYWKQPVSRYTQHPGRDGHPGTPHQAPLSRAGHGGSGHQAPLGRAGHGGECEQVPQSKMVFQAIIGLGKVNNFQAVIGLGKVNNFQAVIGLGKVNNFQAVIGLGKVNNFQAEIGLGKVDNFQAVIRLGMISRTRVAEDMARGLRKEMESTRIKVEIIEQWSFQSYRMEILPR